MLRNVPKYFLIALFSLFVYGNAIAQSDTISSSVNKKRLKLVLGTEIVGYTVSMTGLYSLRYADYEQSSFHFFNDNDEWLYMDKAGHCMTSYYVGKLGMEALRWTGVSDKKAIWYGGTFGLMFLTTVEVFDGLSAEWGFSPGDMIANTSGSILLIGQELLWKEQRMLLKFSYHDTKYPSYRPKLGGNFQERMLKDYNGQTYWLSANIKSFLKNESKFPKWLNFAVGYGIDGVLGGSENPALNDAGVPIPFFERQTQIYFAPDIDLTKIKTKSKLLNTFLGAFGFIKFPLPALEYNKTDGFKAHYFYF